MKKWFILLNFRNEDFEIRMRERIGKIISEKTKTPTVMESDSLEDNS